MAEPVIVAAAFVPGLPHLLAGKPAAGWRDLADATRDLGDAFRAAGVQTLLVVSSQWLSVLGLQIQTRPVIQGTRVDENWYPYDFGTIDYRVKTDVDVAERWTQELRAEGFQARHTDHPDFPVDTGLLVATRLLDPSGGFAVAQVSLNLYGSPESVERLGAAGVRAAATAGRKIAVVAISSLSCEPLQAWIEPADDRIAQPAHDQVNRQILDHLAAGRVGEIFANRDDYVRRGKVDSQLRTLSFLHGALGSALGRNVGGLDRKANIRAYAPVWGMGAAVIDWPIAYAT